MKAVIVGAGIGGLTAALFLHKHGIACEIYERARQVQELGVGINLLPHAVGTLSEVGVLDALVETGICVERLFYRTRFGQTVWDEPRGLAAGLAFPQISIHRGRLQRVLYEAVQSRLPAGSVHLDRSFQSVRDVPGGVEARFTAASGDGETVAADLLIGADGIHSALRGQLYPHEGTPHWSGCVLWRGTADWPAFGDGRSFIITGANRSRLVLFPMARGDTQGTMLTNWVATIQVAPDGAPLSLREDWQVPADRDSCIEGLARFTVPELDIQALAAASKEIWEFPMCDREPLPRWTFGCVTLLGDAAHAMYPYGGNGAAQAILDAKALGAALADAASPAEGLAAYEQDRLAKVYQVVMNNRTGGPERIIDDVESRIDGIVDDIDAVVPFAEREAIVKAYSRLAGFAKEQLTPAQRAAG